MKQALHWLFLMVGMVSIIVLAVSVSTYLDYARSGYGLDVSLTNARLDGSRLLMDVSVENPGGLGMEIIGGNVTLGSTYVLTYLSGNASAENSTSLRAVVYPLDAETVIGPGNSISFTISVQMTEEDLANIREGGVADIALRLNIFVEDRDVRTPLLHETTLEVEP